MYCNDKCISNARNTPSICTSKTKSKWKLSQMVSWNQSEQFVKNKNYQINQNPIPPSSEPLLPILLAKSLALTPTINSTQSPDTPTISPTYNPTIYPIEQETYHVKKKLTTELQHICNNNNQNNNQNNKILNEPRQFGSSILTVTSFYVVIGM